MGLENANDSNEHGSPPTLPLALKCNGDPSCRDHELEFAGSQRSAMCPVL